MPHPYEHLPDHQFWRHAVASLPSVAVDPMVSAPFAISAGDKIATAGSCFAQNIAPALQAQGLQYYVAEAAPDGTPRAEAQRRNFGMFSCRYGNIYTTRQLVQLVQRAYGRFDGGLDAWTRADGRLVDPFRPMIEPDGFASVEALREDRNTHLASVRRMLETLDMLVFTLGQTECWQSRATGAVVPLAPGVAGGVFDDSFTFRNLRVSEVVADFLEFAGELRGINPKARIILTVSPQPLIATYEHKHALVANTATKAVLRAAVEEICAARPDIAYFPAYEIVTLPANAVRFYADNQRNVVPLGIGHVMRLFFRHFAPDRAAAQAGARIDAIREAQHLASVVCDEEALDPDR